MANDNNIKTFTASDIEKYHKGQLLPAEMHDLEKAALDDPFLADALEGYAAAGVNVNADIGELRERLAEKTEQAEQTKVIPINKAGKPFPWLRIAVLIILIAGAGLLSYQFLFKNGAGNNIAESKQIKKEQAKAPNTAPADTASQPNNGSPVTVTSENGNLSGSGNKDGNPKDEKKIVTKEAGQTQKISSDSLHERLEIENTSLPAGSIAKTEEQKKTDNVIPLNNNNAATSKSDMAAADNNKNKEIALKKPAGNNADGVIQMRDKAAESTTENGFAYYNNKRNEDLYRNSNIFRGRVTDANNNALPFANITNTRDNVGTYSDAQGNFTLISPDSVLNVQVRSLGFENSNIQLRNSLADNRVLMQEDRSLNARVLDTVKRSLSRVRKSTMTIEEPEPADGWDSYGAYVANNTNIPETFEKKTGETGENTVEVSFEVNKNGDPVNLRVEKSLCDKCDKEAMRLIKDGPKWKRKAKKSKRATITVPFIKAE